MAGSSAESRRVYLTGLRKLFPFTGGQPLAPDTLTGLQKCFGLISKFLVPSS